MIKAVFNLLLCFKCSGDPFQQRERVYLLHKARTCLNDLYPSLALPDRTRAV